MHVKRRLAILSTSFGPPADFNVGPPSQATGDVAAAVRNVQQIGAVGGESA
jgi:hypothetical protein